MLDWIRYRKRQTWLFDITSDIDIPVLAAASADPTGDEVALGFAAGLNLASAAKSALTEMLQMEVSLEASRALGTGARAWAQWRETVSMKTRPLHTGSIKCIEPNASYNTLEWDLSGVLGALARKGINLWFADMSRKEIGIPVFRAISTCLCHYKPRFARERLLALDARDLSSYTGSPASQQLLLI